MTEWVANVTVSVVSHGQGRLVEQLLAELSACPEIAEVIVTQNISEADIECPEVLRKNVRFISNDAPLGFAANHNQAFQWCSQPYFVVVNPDIILNNGFNPFPALSECIERNGCAIAAPIVLSPSGQVEDSARHFPTLFSLFAKFLLIDDGRYSDLREVVKNVEWVAGMFMFFRSADFRAVGGFDSRFFLYYEDVDICMRLWGSGRKVVLCSVSSVIHDAQRESHRNLRYLKWHLSSMFLYFFKHFGRFPHVD